MFPRIEYLRWIDGRPAAATHDLGTSDLRGDDDGDGVVPERLRDRPAPPADRTLEELIAEEYGVDADWVLATPGASAANAIAAAATLETAGDRVLVERPGYEPLAVTPRGFDAAVDRFERPAPEYPVDPGRIDAALSDDTAMVTVTNRHNPSGRLVDRGTLAEAAETAGRAGARLLVDEVYAPYVADERAGAFGGPTVAGHPDAVVTGSLTKFFGFGGLRIGWLIAEPSLRERAERIATHFGALADPSRALARRALGAADRIGADRRALLDHHHGALADFLDRRSDVSGCVFEGCPYGLVEHDRIDGDDLAAAAWADGVLVVPGRFFDLPGTCRVSLGRGRDHVTTALDALGDVLESPSGEPTDDGRLTNN